MAEVVTAGERRPAPGPGPGSPLGRSWGWALGGVSAVYLLALFLTWPGGFVVSDEAAYAGQAALLGDGQLRWDTLDPFTAAPVSLLLSDYPPGTSLLQAPFAAVAGWPGAVLASAIGLVATAFLLAGWLRREGRSPWFALLVLANPAALVMGRLAMSDVPSMLVVTASLVAFWHGLGPSASSRRWAWPLAGFLAGLSVSFREANPLVPGVFLAGAVLRRERHAWSAVAAGLAGAAVRFGLYAWFLDDPLYLKPPGGGPEGVAEQLQAFGLLVVALTVFVPGGLVAVAAYRGRRRPELVIAVAATVAFFAVYGYAGAASGGWARLVLTPRFVLPVTPLVIFALAEVLPRWAARRTGGLRRPDLARRAAAATVLAALLGTVVTASVLDRRADRSADISLAIQNAIPNDGRLVINDNNMAPYVGPTVGPQPWADRDVTPPPRLTEMLSHPGPVYLVFLDRSGSAFRDEEAATNDAYLAEAGVWTDLLPVADQSFPGGERLRIFQPRLR